MLPKQLWESELFIYFITFLLVFLLFLSVSSKYVYHLLFLLCFPLVLFG